MTRRSLALVAAVVVALVASIGCTAESVEPTATACDVGPSEVLAAQSVPTATAVPCIGDLDDWRATETDLTSDGTVVRLATRDASASWRVEFVQTCEAAAVEPRPWEGAPGTDPVEATVYEQVDEGGDRYRSSTYLVFDGGCVVSELDLPDNRLRPVIVEEADEALHLLPRSVVSAHVERTTDGELRLDP